MKPHQLPLKRRCELLSVARSSAYYQPTQEPSGDEMLMRAMDKIHLRLPFYGSRRIVDELTTVVPAPSSYSNRTRISSSEMEPVRS